MSDGAALAQIISADLHLERSSVLEIVKASLQSLAAACSFGYVAIKLQGCSYKATRLQINQSAATKLQGSKLSNLHPCAKASRTTGCFDLVGLKPPKAVKIK